MADFAAIQSQVFENGTDHLGGRDAGHDLWMNAASGTLYVVQGGTYGGNTLTQFAIAKADSPIKAPPEIGVNSPEFGSAVLVLSPVTNSEASGLPSNLHSVVSQFSGLATLAAYRQTPTRHAFFVPLTVSLGVAFSDVALRRQSYRGGLGA